MDGRTLYCRISVLQINNGPTNNLKVSLSQFLSDYRSDNNNKGSELFYLYFACVFDQLFVMVCAKLLYNYKCPSVVLLVDNEIIKCFVSFASSFTEIYSLFAYLLLENKLCFVHIF